MDSPPIYVDMDDVLCETARGLLSVLEREFDRRVAFDQIHDFDLTVSFGLTPNELERFFALVHRPEPLLALDPLPGAIETVRAWSAAGAEIAVVTGRPAHTRDISRRWLERHGVPHRELTFVDKYGRAGSASEDEEVLPLESLRRDSYRLAVEDSLPTARFLAERGMPVLLVDRPWNRGSAEGVHRCRDWGEVGERAGALLDAGRSARSTAPISS